MNDKTDRLTAIVGLILTFVILLLIFRPSSDPAIEQVPYSQLKQLVREGEISSVSFDGRRIDVTLDGEAGIAAGTGSEGPHLRSYLPEIDDDALIPLLEEHNVTIVSQPSGEGASPWLTLFLPWIFILGIYLWMQNRLYGGLMNRFGGRDVGDFLHGSARKEQKNDAKVTFADVAGQDPAKKEVAELAVFLKKPDKLRALGAEAPRGVLLMGPPGTGKTLLARALAGEAGVPFFSISASEFIEMFVGVGASRVRAMFAEARKRAPSIIFIDELDSIGRIRGTGLGGGHDEREQTLNQILSEMDGFSGHEPVIVLAATNRPDVLDPALLRPGRFDRHVSLELPDREARLAILKVHTRKTPIEPDVDLALLAAQTPGFSGADLKNLVNEAALAAARDGMNAVAATHLEEMRDKVMMGTVRTLAVQPDERHRLAVHEAGHTAVAHHLPNADPVHKVTIIPRGRSLGSTHMLPDHERQTLPENYLRDRLAVMLGGRAAEKLFLGSVSSGADDDIREATKLARAMVSRWGMSEEIGPIDLRQSDEHPFLGREIAQPRHFSEASAHQVDQAVQALLRQASERAEQVLTDGSEAIQKLIRELEAKETLSAAEIERCLNQKSDVLQLHQAKTPGRPRDTAR
ncbi:MAG: ATP-dependent zinc metalloprotease FtsH [Geminicoccaceae bacterium]